MNNSTKSFDEMIQCIHGAVLSRTGWDEMISDLCHAFGATGASIVRPSRRFDIPPYAAMHVFDADAIKRYAEHWGRHDVWYAGARRLGRTGMGVVNLDSQLIDRREFKASPFYNEYLLSINIERMMNVCIARPDQDYGETAFSLYRAPGQAGFTIDDAALLSALAPHLATAAKNYWSIQDLRTLAGTQARALDACSSALLGISATCKLTIMNLKADELLSEARWLRVSNGVVEASPGCLEFARLAQALWQLATGIAFNLIVTDHVGGAQAVVQGAPTPPSEEYFGDNRAVALIWVTPIVSDTTVASVIAECYALTVAERRLLAQMIGGNDLRDAAERLNVSLHTARTQLKAIFQKTGKRTQAALLSFAARVSSVRSPPQSSR